MAGIGRQVLVTSGNPIRISADGRPEMKIAGISIDWSTVAAVGSDTTIPIEMTVVKNGNKYLRYGQFMTKITNTPTQTVTISAAGGTFALSGTRPDTQFNGKTAAVAYNATAATLQTALEAIYGAGNVAVSGSAGGPYTVNLKGILAAMPFPLMVSDASLLTGGANTAVVAVGNAGTAPNNGMYGPYDPAATDGRQTLVRGECGFVPETLLQSGLVVGMPTGITDFAPLLTGGTVYKDRLIATNSTHSLAAGPTFAEMEAVLTRLRYAEN